MLEIIVIRIETDECKVVLREIRNVRASGSVVSIFTSIIAGLDDIILFLCLPGLLIQL
jgi:hypothetical protein